MERKIATIYNGVMTMWIDGGKMQQRDVTVQIINNKIQIVFVSFLDENIVHELMRHLQVPHIGSYTRIRRHVHLLA